MDIQTLTRVGQPNIAYVYSAADENGKAFPTVMFCGGYRSDMCGTKATFLEEQCRARGQAYLRFDYSGHGQSGGAFKDGTIGSWCEDAQAVFNAVINGPVIIVGSSMGGWIALLLAEIHAVHVRGLIGVAAAPDFTEKLYHNELNDEHRALIDRQGYVEIPNAYSDEPYMFTKALFENGKDNLMLNRDHEHDYPITLLHGLRDATVAKEVPIAIKDRYSGGPLDIIYIDDGDHSLSRPQDLKILDQEIIAMNTPQIL